MEISFIIINCMLNVVLNVHIKHTPKRMLCIQVLSVRTGWSTSWQGSAEQYTGNTVYCGIFMKLFQRY